MSMLHGRSQLFARHLPKVAGGCADVAALESLLNAWISAGRRAWPEVELAEEDFLRHLAQRLTPGDEPRTTLAHVPATDLYLACACAGGLPAAHVALEKHFLANAVRAASRIRGGGVDAEVLLQRLRQQLLALGEDKERGITRYPGAGPLSAWLRAVAVLTAFKLQHEKGRAPKVESPAREDLPQMEREARRRELRRRYQEDFREALSMSVPHLTQRACTVARLHLVEGVGFERLGVMYHAHKSTVERWVEGVSHSLRAWVLTHLKERLRLPFDDLLEVLVAVDGQIVVSLPSLLRETTQVSSTKGHTA